MKKINERKECTGDMRKNKWRKERINEVKKKKRVEI